KRWLAWMPGIERSFFWWAAYHASHSARRAVSSSAISTLYIIRCVLRLCGLEELDAHIVVRVDERDLHARPDRAGLHLEVGAAPLELGHGLVHVVHAQPEVIEPDVRLGRRGWDRGVRRDRCDEDREPVQVEIGTGLAVGLD